MEISLGDPLRSANIDRFGPFERQTGDFNEAVVRITGERLRFVVAEQFGPVAVRRSEIGNSQRFKINFDDLSPDFRPELIENRLVGDRLDPTQRPSAGKSDGFARRGRPDNRRIGRSRIVFVESERLGQLVKSAANNDSGRTGDRFFAEFAECGLRLVKRFERAVALVGVRLGQRAGPVVAAEGRNVKCRLARAGFGRRRRTRIGRKFFPWPR